MALCGLPSRVLRSLPASIIPSRWRYCAVKSERDSQPSNKPGWRAMVLWGAGVLAVALILNLTVLIWAETRPRPENAALFSDSVTLYSGDCNKTTKIKTWAHLLINLISTLIFATSATCMQCLSSPTRNEIDQAHRRGRWVDIGILSTGNLRSIDRRRFLLYCALALAALPLHLLYNSTINTTLSTNDHLSLMVMPQFVDAPLQNATTLESFYLDGAPMIDEGAYSGPNPYRTGAISNSSWKVNDTMIVDAITELQIFLRSSNTKLQNMSAGDCVNAMLGSFISPYSNLILVFEADLPQNETGLSGLIDLSFAAAPGRPAWSCYDYKEPTDGIWDFWSACDPSLNRIQDRFWDKTYIPTNLTLDYCLFQQEPEFCTVELSRPLMLAVVLSNAFKLAITLWVALGLNFSPIITVGDAIASFMKTEDEETSGVGIYDEPSLRTAKKATRLPPGSYTWGGNVLVHYFTYINDHCDFMHRHQWRARKWRWYHSVPRHRWVITYFLWLSLAGAVTYFTVQAVRSTGLSLAWSAGFGSTNPGMVSARLAGLNIIAEAAVINSPQFAVSLLYLLYNRVITTMLAAAEISDFASQAKPLRVSPPRSGVQRGTYWLQMPFRYSLPLLVITIVLHWLISQSFFLVRMSSYDINGNLEDPNLINSAGYSLRAVVFALACTLMLLLIAPILGLRRFPEGIPLFANNSMALSTACHAHPDEDPKACSLPVKFGTKDDPRNPQVRWMGFSAGHVESLQDGDCYHFDKCISTVLDEYGVKAKRSQCVIETYNEGRRPIRGLHDLKVNSLAFVPQKSTFPRFPNNYTMFYSDRR